MGSLLRADRMRGMQLKEAPRFAVRLRAGERAEGKGGRPVYATLGTLVDKHRRKGSAAAGSPLITLADKASQVRSWANIFTTAAAVAQKAPSTPPPVPSSPLKKGPSQGEQTEDPWVLQMPAITPSKGSHEELRRTSITLSDLRAAQTPGKMVSESVVDSLRRYEEQLFMEGARAKGLMYLVAATSIVRVCDSAYLVQQAERHGSVRLASPRLTEDELAAAHAEHQGATTVQLQDGRGYYAYVANQLALASAKKDKVLVALTVPANGHFAEAFLLPQSQPPKVILVDSYSECGLEKVTRTSIVPFARYLMDCSVGVECKDDKNGIARQPIAPRENTNTCGFAATHFLNRVLIMLLELGEQARGSPIDLPTLGTALEADILAMTVASESVYAVKRMNSKHDLAHLVTEYHKIRLR